MLAIRRGLDERGVGEVGIVGKCRPDSLTPDLARSLAALGVIRLYVGVENASDGGARHLNRARQTEHVRAALAACRDAGIFVCYNLLVFEPDTTIDDVRANVAFIREHAAHPINFCRAEPYSGTPLQLDLARRDALGGSYLGWDYRLSDPRAELAFRICAAAFRQRNFDPSGVANRYMGLGYSLKILEHFHPDPDHAFPALAARVAAVNHSISTETASLLEEALDLASALPLGDEDRAMRSTALLGLRVAEADAGQHAALDSVYAELQAFVRQRPRPRPRIPRRLVELAQGLALGAGLASTASACQEDVVVDPVPEDSGRIDGPLVADPLPMAAGVDGPFVVDPVPPDALVADPPPPDAGIDGLVADPPPPDAALDGAVDAAVDGAPDAADDVWVPDARPEFGPVDPLPADASAANDPLIDQWRDTAPRRAARGADLPLSEPPVVRLAARRSGQVVQVELAGGPQTISTRWEGDGRLDAEGRHARWRPRTDDDQVRVAVRSRHGVAVVALRARDLPT